ncbi:MAG: CheR family methyltransferase [Promethearchaeota archaeon]
MKLIESIHIDTNSYHKLLKLLRVKTGLNFEYYNKHFIEKRIKARMIRVKCADPEDYLKEISSKENEVKKFVDGFTINYTFFFRDYDIFETFQDVILQGLNVSKRDIDCNIKPDPLKLAKFRSKANAAKNLMKNRQTKPDNNYMDLFIFLNKLSFYKKLKLAPIEKNCINIWSCPCATGEEPYSIAMIMDNLKSQITRFPKYRIVASDIAHEAVEKAKTGIFSDDAMKEISDYYEIKYFTKQKTHFGHNNLISSKIKGVIEWIEEDVTKGHKKSYKYDIIFCRYLLIYFNRENRTKFLKIIEDRLVENGILILGKTESLLDKKSSFKLVDSRNRIYIKSHSNIF